MIGDQIPETNDWRLTTREYLTTDLMILISFKNRVTFSLLGLQPTYPI